MLAPSICLCLAVPVCPSLRERVSPGPAAELGPSITAESRVLWWESRESTALENIPWEQPNFWAGAGPNGCWGNWDWQQREGGSSQASSAPSSAHGGLWRASQAAWPLRECSDTKTLAEGMEKTTEHCGGRKHRALKAGGARQSQFPPGRWPHCQSPTSASLARPQPAAILPVQPQRLEEPWWGAVPFPACPPCPLGKARAAKLTLTSPEN